MIKGFKKANENFSGALEEKGEKKRRRMQVWKKALVAYSSLKKPNEQSRCLLWVAYLSVHIEAGGEKTNKNEKLVLCCSLTRRQNIQKKRELSSSRTQNKLKMRSVASCSLLFWGCYGGCIFMACFAKVSLEHMPALLAFYFFQSHWIHQGSSMSNESVQRSSNFQCFPKYLIIKPQFLHTLLLFLFVRTLEKLLCSGDIDGHMGNMDEVNPITVLRVSWTCHA